MVRFKKGLHFVLFEYFNLVNGEEDVGTVCLFTYKMKYSIGLKRIFLVKIMGLGFTKMYTHYTIFGGNFPITLGKSQPRQKKISGGQRCAEP